MFLLGSTSLGRTSIADFFIVVILQEDSLSLLTIIKGTCKYRRSRKSDPILDFLPPSRTEFNYAFDQVVG